MKKVTIDKSTLSNFVMNLTDRRAIRQSKVNDLIALCKSGKHFSSPFVVNKVNGKYRDIDGNHRYEAISQCIKDDSTFKIEVWLAVYKDLTIDEERDIFTTWNKGTVQSSTDFLKMHFDTIPLGKSILSRLPTTIYGGKTSLKIVNLMGGQISAKKHHKFEGGYASTKEGTIYDFKNLTLTDLDNVELFVEFMENTFGKFHSVNNKQFYQTTPLSVFYRIWFDNKVGNGLSKLFIRAFENQSKSWAEFTKSGGRSACQSFYRNAIGTLKGLAPDNMKILDDVEALEKYEQENKQ